MSFIEAIDIMIDLLLLDININDKQDIGEYCKLLRLREKVDK